MCGKMMPQQPRHQTERGSPKVMAPVRLMLLQTQKPVKNQVLRCAFLPFVVGIANTNGELDDLQTKPMEISCR